MKKKFHILFICSGNICRSPMAEGLLRAKIPEKWQNRVMIQSAGTLFIKGVSADSLAILVMAWKGVDISGHRSQGVSSNWVKKANLILVMEESHLDFFQDLNPNIIKKTHLLKAFGKSQAEIEKLTDSAIADPIGGKLEDFMACSDTIEAEIERIWPMLHRIIAEHFEEKTS